VKALWVALSGLVFAKADPNPWALPRAMIELPFGAEDITGRRRATCSTNFWDATLKSFVNESNRRGAYFFAPLGGNEQMPSFLTAHIVTSRRPSFAMAPLYERQNTPVADRRYSFGMPPLFVFACIFCAMALIFGGGSTALLGAGAPAAQIAPSTAPESQVQHELLNLYLADARVQDLLTTLKPASWKMTDADRSTLDRNITEVQTQLRAVEKWRYQLLYHPQDTNAAKSLLGTLAALISNVQIVRAGVTKYQNKAAAAPIEQSVMDLGKLSDELGDSMAKVFPNEFERHPPGLSATAAPPPSPVEREKTRTSKPPTQLRPSPAVPASPAVHLEPSQVQALLMKVYLATARINDLLSLAQPGAWKMSDAERTAFKEQVQSLQSQLVELEKWRYQFSYAPGNEQLGAKAVAALDDVVSTLSKVATAESQFQNTAAGAQFDQPQKQLREAHASLKSYLGYLQLKYRNELAAQPPGSAGLQTVRIGPPATSAPLTSITVATPPLTPTQVKSILYSVYVSAFRIHDLLTQDHPKAWKAPPAERTEESAARSTVLARMVDAEKWRSLFSEDPGNMYYAFQAYRSIENLLQPLSTFSRGAGQFENASMEAAYGDPAADIQSSLDQLIPYISFILQHESDSVFLYQNDLARCQNQLTYAMHSSLHAATPMKNVLPVFQGRRVERRRAAKTKAKSQSRKRQ
jgi:hypothetical protein